MNVQNGSIIVCCYRFPSFFSQILPNCFSVTLYQCFRFLRFSGTDSSSFLGMLDHINLILSSHRICARIFVYFCVQFEYDIKVFPHSLHRNNYTVYTFKFLIFFDSYSLHRNLDLSFLDILPYRIIFTTRIPCMTLKFLVRIFPTGVFTFYICISVYTIMFRFLTRIPCIGILNHLFLIYFTRPCNSVFPTRISCVGILPFFSIVLYRFSLDSYSLLRNF